MKILEAVRSNSNWFFTEEMNKVALRLNDDKKCNQLIQYGYQMNKDLISERKEIKCNHLIKGNKND